MAKANDDGPVAAPETASPVLDNDGIGTVGQDAFKLWCSQRQVAALLAVKDRFGWDYYLQWAHDADPLEPPERSCKVQVKTTATGASSASIKLSNWKRMALEHTPWFVAAISLKGVEVEEAHLVHIDEGFVKRVVSRLSEIGDDPSIALHDVYMNVRWEEEHRLSVPFYDGLHAALMKHIAGSEAEYRDAKRGWIDAARRAAAATYVATFKIEGATDDEIGDLLSRFAIGLIDKIPIKDFNAVLKRFGKEVNGAAAVVDAETATMQLSDRQPDRQTRITIFDRDRSEMVEFELDTYTTASVFPWLPKRHYSVRFAGPMLSFVWQFINEEDATFTASFDVPQGDAAAKLSDLARVCRAARMFSAAQSRGLFATLVPGSTAAVPALDLSAAPAAFDPDFLDFSRVVEEAALLARVFDLNTDQIVVRPSELLRRRFAIRMLAAGLDRSLAQVDLRVAIDPDEPVAGRRAAMIVPAIVPLGPYVVVGAFTLGGIADWKQMSDGHGTMGITDAEVKLRFQQVVSRDEWDGGEMKQRVASLAEVLEAEGIDVVAIL